MIVLTAGAKTTVLDADSDKRGGDTPPRIPDQMARDPVLRHLILTPPAILIYYISQLQRFPMMDRPNMFPKPLVPGDDVGVLLRSPDISSPSQAAECSCCQGSI